MSERERGVTGLIFALAGYLVQDLHEKVPFMSLNLLEAIDSDRIAQFVDYTGYLVVTLLQEDARTLDGSVNRVTAI